MTTTSLRIGVLARGPGAGRAKPELLAAHGASWVDGLYAAMLRDTLDGLQAIDADDYVVFADPGGAEALARHAPLPWRVVEQPETSPEGRVLGALGALLAEGGRAVLAASDAPSYPTEPLAEALAEEDASFVLGPSEDGGVLVIATSRLEPRLLEGAPFGTPALVDTIRARCTDLGIAPRPLPTWYDVDRPSDVLRLLDELRRHPERAPRTAQFLVTAG